MALRCFKSYASEEDNHPSENSDKQEINIRGYVYPVLISIMGIAISYEITVMLFPGINIPFLILLITSLGIGLSFIPKIRENKEFYEANMKQGFTEMEIVPFALRLAFFN